MARSGRKRVRRTSVFALWTLMSSGTFAQLSGTMPDNAHADPHAAGWSCDVAYRAR